MQRLRLFLFSVVCSLASVAHATVFGRVTGVVHDPQHHPIRGAQIELHAATSALTFHTTTDDNGAFTILSVPVGDYLITVSQPGFTPAHQSLTLASETSSVLHFSLQLSSVQQTVSVHAETEAADVNTVTPSTLISRSDIAQTPGADRTRSLAIITDLVPGAYITHDMLHIRGGHQVSWLIDGVQIPNTNIAGNVGAQIDPKDIDYLEVQRGSYTADIGDRTFGAFNIVPRTGFERDRQAELVFSAGSFLQTNDQLNFGDHTQKFAYYASLNANRSDLGLSPPTPQPHHDAANGYGAFTSLIYNRSPKDQFRLVSQARSDFFQIPSDPNPNSSENQQFDSSGLRDSQTERDAFAAFSWLHTFRASTVLQLSPFFHTNLANCDPNPSDIPVATRSHRISTYAGAQASLSTVIGRNTLQTGLLSFGQHDNALFAATFNDNTDTPSFSTSALASGGLIEAFLSDNFRATPWLTLIAGLRQSHFQGDLTENATSPRVGLALRLPKVNWVIRGFYGRFYQPPPLLTASGPIVEFAQANNTAFIPLHGEHDEEHQFGLQIPLRGWLLDADTFHTRARNFLDHSSLGNSSLYYPVTVDGALIRAWELSLRSPRLWRYGQAHLAYSNQIAQQRGNLTGGLICTPIADPACDSGFTYTPVDHDQRNTLSLGFNASLPHQLTAATNISYGSGFVNGSPDPATPYPNPYLPPHTTFDLSIAKAFGQNVSLAVNALNVANRRVLIDNSRTFGGFHFNDPRELYAELRYRFHY